jgi:hypothetical protein
MRSAWKARRAGWGPVRRAAAGTAAAGLVDEPGDAAGEALLAVLAQDAGQLGAGIVVDHLGRGDPAGRVHAHVEGRVGAVAEAAFGLVELQRRDAQVVEDPVDRRQPEPVRHLGQVGEGGGHRDQAVPRPGEPLAGQGEGGRVAVEADHPSVGGAGLQQSLGVAAEAEGGVEVGAAWPRPQQLDHPVDHDRLVADRSQHHQIPSSARWAALVSSE